jgi:lipopolysaccharide/colanic/teichoic acid biosynthesis glycosyltransferase
MTFLKNVPNQESGSFFAIEDKVPTKAEVPWPPGATSDDRWISYRIREHFKRGSDLALLLVGLPIYLPVMACLAIAIKLDSPGPVIFSQDQLGRGNCRIRPLKFRTMHMGAEDRLQHLLAQGGPLAEEYRQFHKLKKDPRVTRVGRLLRRSSLDELPQLWNVFKGDMSLVGPRPDLPRELPEMLGKEQIILQKRPGITGLWQVNGRNETTFQARVKMDVHYVRTWSLRRDFRILLGTIKVVLGAKGAR